jgi:hypothetical protein
VTTVIIGHGTSPLKKGWGREIDKHTVVRMKDPRWQNEFDYGSRVDYLSASTEVMHSMLLTKKNPKEYWCQPKKGEWDAAAEIDFRQKAKGRAPMVILEEPFYTWNKVYLDMRPDPTAQLGFRNFSLGTFTILTVLDRLKETDVRLVGFDNLMEPDLWEYHKGDRGIWKSWHDWHTEKGMLPLFEEHYGATITEWR